MNESTDDGGDSGSSSVGRKRKDASFGDESENHLCDGSVLMSYISVDMSIPHGTGRCRFHLNLRRHSSCCRHCFYDHHRRFRPCVVDTGSGVNDPNHDGGDVVSVSVGIKRKVTEREGESKHNPCDGSLLMFLMAVDVNTSPSHGWFLLHIHHHLLASRGTHCYFCHRSRFPTGPVHAGGGVNDRIDDGRDGVSVSVGSKKNVAGREGESEHHPCHGSSLTSFMAVDMSIPIARGVLALRSPPPTRF